MSGRRAVTTIVLVLLGSLALAVGMANLEPFCLLRPRRGWWKWREDELAERAAGDGKAGHAARV